MFARKPLFIKTSARPELMTHAFDADDAPRPSPAQQVKITSLEIERDCSVNCDPYNSTGQFFVLKSR